MAIMLGQHLERGTISRTELTATVSPYIVSLTRSYELDIRLTLKNSVADWM